MFSFSVSCLSALMLIASSDILPVPHQMKATVGEPFRFTEKTLILLRQEPLISDWGAAELIQQRIKEVSGLDIKVEPWTPDASMASAILIGEEGALPGLENLKGLWQLMKLTGQPEGYRVASSKDAVCVIGDTPQGSFYGAVTLVHLITSQGIAPVMVRDWPEFRMRATYDMPEPTEDALKRFALLKLNAVVVESGDYFNLDAPEVLDRQKKFFDLCAKYNMEPIPLLQSWGHGGNVISRDFSTGEGITVTEELAAQDWATLANNNVLDLETCPLLVESQDGSVKFVRDQDFEVEKGDFGPQVTEQTRPWKIKAKAGGKIPVDARIKVTYSYLPPETRSYCPSDPETQRIMKKALQSTATLLKPKHIHIGHDEPERVNSDLRCRTRGVPDAEIMSEEINLMNAFVHEVDPSIRIMMWEDAINPVRGGNGDAAKDVDKDILQCVWFYGTGRDEVDREARSLAFFADQGFECTGSPWYEPVNAFHWCENLAKEKVRTGKALGCLYTSWNCAPEGKDPWGGLTSAAAYSWNPGVPYPIWPLGLNEFFGCALQEPSVREMWAGMAERVNRKIIAGAEMSSEWEQFTKTLSDLEIKARNLGAAQDASSQVRMAYSALQKWIQGEEHSTFNRREEAASCLDALCKLSVGLCSAEAQKTFQTAVMQYRKNAAIPFPSSADLFGAFLVPKRPGLEVSGDVTFLPYEILPISSNGRFFLDLGEVKDNIVRMDFLSPHVEMIDFSAGKTLEELVPVTFNGGSVVTTSAPLCFDAPSSFRYCLIGVKAKEGQEPSLNQLLISQGVVPAEEPMQDEEAEAAKP